MKNISIIMAMQGEAEPLIQQLKLQKKAGIFSAEIPFGLFQGSYKELQLSLVTGGIDSQLQVENVATVPATLMSYLAIEKCCPDLVINSGTAGGIGKEGCRIGDVYLSSGNFCFHDRRIPIPGFDQYGRGGYPSYDCSDMARELQLKTGGVSTGNSLDMLAEDMQLIKENQAIIKDMEAAAIAWVCQTMGVPMFAVKSITDLIDQETPTETQFLENFQLAVSQLQERSVKVLDYLESSNGS